MQFVTGKQNLLSALTIVGKAVGKNIIPAVEMIKLDIKGNSLKLTGGDMRVFIEYTIEIQSDIEKSILVPGADLLNLIKTFPDIPLSFQIEEKTGEKGEKRITLHLTASGGEYVFPVEPGEDYPKREVVSETETYDLNTEEFLRGLNKTLFAYSNDDTRPNLTGVLLTFGEDKANFTATNTHILSTYSADITCGLKQEVLVPGKALNFIQQTPVADVIKVSISTSFISFKTNDDVELTVRLIDERYPDYRGVIPQNNTFVLDVNRTVLSNALKRVASFSASNNLVKFSLDNGLVISAEDDVKGKAKETIPVNYNGDAMEIGLSGHYLISCLSKMDSEDVKMYFNAPNRAVLIRNEDVAADNFDNLILCMPMYLNKA